MFVRSIIVRAASRRVRRAALLSSAVVLAPAPAFAQAGIEIGPTLSYQMPLGNYDAALPSTARDLRGWMWGAQARFWLTGRFGVLIESAVRSSRFDAPYPPCMCCVPCLAQAPTTSAKLIHVAAQILVRPFASGSPLWLSAGGGVVRRSGQAYADAGIAVPTSFAVAVGCGVDARIGGPLVATLGITTMLYQLDEQDAFGDRFGPGFQTDVRAYAGLSWRWSLNPHL